MTHSLKYLYIIIYKLLPGLFFITCLLLFFQNVELMTPPQIRVMRRERTPLSLLNSSLRCRNAVLPCCWTHLTTLLYIFEGPWYHTHMHRHTLHSYTNVLQMTIKCTPRHFNCRYHCMKTTNLSNSVFILLFSHNLYNMFCMC